MNEHNKLTTEEAKRVKALFRTDDNPNWLRRRGEEGIPEQKAESEVPEEQEECGYCIWTSRKGSLFGITIRIPDEGYKSVEYYDVEIDATNEYIKIITGSRKVWMIEIWGRGLLKSLSIFKEHRVELVQAAHADCGDMSRPYVSRVKLMDVTEQPKAKQE